MIASKRDRIFRWPMALGLGAAAWLIPAVSQNVRAAEPRNRLRQETTVHDPAARATLAALAEAIRLPSANQTPRTVERWRDETATLTSRLEHVAFDAGTEQFEPTSPMAPRVDPAATSPVAHPSNPLPSVSTSEIPISAPVNLQPARSASESRTNATTVEPTQDSNSNPLRGGGAIDSKPTTPVPTANARWKNPLR